LVARLAAETGANLRHVPSPTGMTVQRNFGLDLVSYPVVFYPDDDSLVLPGTMSEIMKIYDLDTDGIIGGVCSAESKVPPKGVLEKQPGVYKMTFTDRLKARVARTRFALEYKFVPEPFHVCAARKYSKLPPAPNWMAENNAILVPSMTGFRMSFRTEVLRQFRFTEELGRYAVHEDIDASLGVLDTHLLVGARNAQIYHHKAPDRRANGRSIGAMQVLNRAYVLAMAGEADTEMLAKTRYFCGYKIVQYIIGSRSSFGKERLAGARQAYKLMPALFNAPPEQINQIYLDLRQRCFSHES
jgi:hypothetical protein